MRIKNSHIRLQKLNISSQTDLAIEILNGSCPKCYNQHEGNCIAVDREVATKLFSEYAFITSPFIPTDCRNGVPESGFLGTYTDTPVYLKKRDKI